MHEGSISECDAMISLLILVYCIIPDILLECYKEILMISNSYFYYRNPLRSIDQCTPPINTMLLSLVPDGFFSTPAPYSEKKT